MSDLSVRINKFLAQNTELSRRKADEAIAAGRVSINGKQPQAGDTVNADDKVLLDGETIRQSKAKEGQVLLVDKPVGYVCSRDGQGSPTVYDLVSGKYAGWNIAGRLDKDSSGLVILTNDGELLNELTHPSNNKTKVYEITTNRTLKAEQIQQLTDGGVDIGEERPSRFVSVKTLQPCKYRIVLGEGRNRQIRRTIEGLSPNLFVRKLHRTQIGDYQL